MSRVVFVGNVPYDVEEDKLVPIFSTVGPIAGFRLMIDKESGKSKGYAFCEYHDHDTAASAVRNLNGTEVNGRPLRIDLADSDPFFEGKSTQSGRTKRDDDDRRREKFDPLASLPPGVTIPVGSSALDVITKSLANIPPAQMLDILGQMKQYIVNSPEHARNLLNTHPQLAYAFFQAMLLNNMIDPTTLQRMIASSNQGGVPSAPPTGPQYRAPPPAAPIPPPTAPAQPQYYGTVGVPPAPPVPTAPAYPANFPPPTVPRVAPPAAAPTQPSASANIPEDQKAMLLQILSLTPEQINALPPTERTTVQQLRAQFMGTM
ncbi:hypothetical protein FRC04_001563 [Tulasnella sp. 424]|nr:hypothetical protein FRC04_001563 [Tulasnella sp. 424]KAG8961644.1 hypothetical protein FRC05_005848 [Tulasnella sp. 425]